MSKRTRMLLISSIALVALGGLLAVLLLTGVGKQPDETDPTAPDTSVVLLDKPEGVKVTSIAVSLPDEEFEIVTGKDGALVVKGFEDLPQGGSYSSIAEQLLDITASRLAAKAPENPADFGFDDPTKKATKITATYSDKEQFSFEIGKEATNGGHYLRTADSPDIYLIRNSFVNAVSIKSMDYLNMMPLSAPATEDDKGELVVRDVTLTGSIRKEPLAFQISTEVLEDGQQAQYLTGFIVTKPYRRNLKNDTDMMGAASYYAFMATSVAKIKPSEEDLVAYGLAEPYSQCDFTLSIKKTEETLDESNNKKTTITFHDDLTQTIKLGNLCENGVDRYATVYVEDKMIPLLYTVDPSALVWAEKQYDDIADQLLFFTYIYHVDEMTITHDGATHKFELTHFSEEEDRDDKLMVVSNRVQYDTDDFRTLYQGMMDLTRKDSLDKLPDSEPFLQIDIKTNSAVAHSGWIRMYETEDYGDIAVLHDTGEMYLVDEKAVRIFREGYREFLKNE